MLMAGHINIKVMKLKLAWKNYWSQHWYLEMCFWTTYTQYFTCLPQMAISYFHQTESL